MAKLTLTVVDTSGIQTYIFGSNRLRENVGASHLVELATGRWLRDALPEPHNLIAQQGEDHLGIDPDWHIDKQTKGAAELIYRGGGKAVLLFASPDVAKEFAARLSRRVLREAHGLRIAIAHRSLDWDNEPLGGWGEAQRSEPKGALQQTIEAAEAARLRHSNRPLPGLSVTLACRSSGQPAIGFDPEETGRPISAEILAKVRPNLLDAADDRLRAHLRDPSSPPGADVMDRYGFSRDLDDLNRVRGEISYVAVAHIDGNGIGARFRELLRTFSQPGPGNRACINALRSLSTLVNTASSRALRGAIRGRLLDAFREPHFERFVRTLPDDDKGLPILPVRPLVFGGDDVTFVCDGRLGLVLAAAYLEAFERAVDELLPPFLQQLQAETQSLKNDQHPPALLLQPIRAAAGVTIVKTHYPFSRAYALSEELCRSVKDEVGREQSGIDWQIAPSGISAQLADLRRRDYTSPGYGPLTLRPLALHDTTWRSWPRFVQTVETLLYDPLWRGRRNKVVALREALRAGPPSVRQFRTRYGLERLSLPEPPTQNDDLKGSGWMADEGDGMRSLYFDAVEALDLYQPLHQPSEVRS